MFEIVGAEHETSDPGQKQFYENMTDNFTIKSAELLVFFFATCFTDPRNSEIQGNIKVNVLFLQFLVSSHSSMHCSISESIYQCYFVFMFC